MRTIRRAALAVLAVTSTACYHAVVDTGRAAGTTVISQPWAKSYVFGLVPVADIETASECPAGVARVETQQSVANSLVGIITLGIFTPQTVTITCASGGTGALPGGRTLDVGEGATLQQKIDAVNAAAEQAGELGAPVFVRF